MFADWLSERGDVRGQIVALRSLVELRLDSNPLGAEGAAVLVRPGGSAR